MAASKASSNRTKESRGAWSPAGSKAQRSADARQRSKGGALDGSTRANRPAGGVADGLSGLAEQLANRIIKPLGLVVLSSERIQETLDEAADRGRLTRTDANELGSQLVQRGRQQTEELLADIERLLGRGRQQLDSATRKSRIGEPLDRLVRGAGLARRRVAGEADFPIRDYDEMPSGQVQRRLGSLAPAELRKVRDYERRHANRKSVLAAIDKLLG
jgi:polyhydroxyalkanoate synthesis regulator phasin